MHYKWDLDGIPLDTLAMGTIDENCYWGCYGELLELLSHISTHALACSLAA
jgi:hypothetical protein